jgi:hypothetical protein
MTSRQATFSPKLSRCLSRASHPSLPLSPVSRPVFHAKCAKRSRRFRISDPMFFSTQSLAPGVRWCRAHGSRRFVGPERLAAAVR